MRLRSTRDATTGDVYLNRDDLVAALRASAPAARSEDATECLSSLAELLSRTGGPPRDPKLAPVVGGQLWTPEQADRRLG